LRENAKHPLEKVLEIGTGCGYQTAILSRIAREVYSIERIGPLLTRTRIRLLKMGVRNVFLRHADGMLGLPEAGPYNGIILTAFIREIPEALLGQLSIGGRVVFPRGDRKQHLCLIEHTTEGFVESVLDEVMFVPMLPGTVNR